MKKLRPAAVILMIAMVLVYGGIAARLRQQLRDGYSDFISLYTAGKILRRGEGPRLYDLDLQYRVQREVAPRVAIRSGALPYVRPPFEAWLFLPLAGLPYRLAFFLWDALSLGMLVASILRIRREMPELRRFPGWMCCLFACSFFPVFVTLLQGQDSILLLLIYALAYGVLRRGSEFAGGAILALGTIKFPLAVPFVLAYAMKGKTRVLAGFLLGALCLAGVSVATVGGAGLAYYPRYLLNIHRLAPGVNVPLDMPNLRGLLSLLALPAAARGIVLAGLSLVLLAVAVYGWRVNAAAENGWFGPAFGLTLVVTLLVGYHAHVFDLALLLIPIAAMFSALPSRNVSDSARNFLRWSLGLAIFSPLYLLLSMQLRLTCLLSVVLLLCMAAILATIRRGETAPPAA